MGDADPTIAEQEHRVFSLLRSGDVLGALSLSEREPADQRTLKLAVLRAEARGCLGRGDLHELDGLESVIVAGGGDEAFLARVEAARADYYGSRGDPMCGTIAAPALARLAAQPLLATELFWVRGRLHRALALAAALRQQEEPATAVALLERALADLHRAGFDAEATRSAAEVHAAVALGFGDGYDRARDIVLECLARLRELASSYVDLVLAYRVVLDLAIGDLAAMHAGADEMERIGATRPLHPLARLVVSSVRIASRLVGEGPTDAVLRAVDDHLALVRTQAMPFAASQFVALASALIDAGHTGPTHLALARRWASQAVAGVPGATRTKQDLAALETRLDLLERGDDSAVDAVDDDLEEGRRLGLYRNVAQRALAAALAARRIGRGDVAERLYLQALADLPRPEGRTLWENALVAAVVATRVTGSPVPSLRLLGPTVTVENRTPRALSTALARLVVALVTEGGAAPVDRLVDVLWPDADLDTGRARLRVTLHRLRRSLAAEPDADPLPRRRGLVTFAPNIDVDTMRFEKLATGTTKDRRAAIVLYQGDVAWVQLAYDDIAAPLRRRLATVWREIAVEAVSDPALPRATVTHIAEIARREADTDPELAHLLGLADQRLRSGMTLGGY